MLSSANEGSFLSFLAKCRTFSAYSGSHISHNFGEASPCITRKSCAIWKTKTKTKTGHSLLKCKYGMHSVCNMFQWSHTMPGLMRWGYSVSISKTSFELFARIQLARYKTVSFMYNWTWEKGSELFFSHSFCCSDLSSGVVGSIEKDRIGKRYIGFLHLWKFS